MSICPDCGFENIEGSDQCDSCGAALTDINRREPKSAVEADLLKDRIETLNPRAPLTVERSTSVRDVLSMLIDNWVGCAVVVDGDEVVGVFSERDAFMRIGVDAPKFADTPIEEFMTPKPVTLAARDKIAFAIHKMNVGGYRHIPILTDGKLTGIISVRDVLDYLATRIAAAKADLAR